MLGRRAALVLVAALAVGAAACGGQDDASEAVETERATGDLASAVSSAQAAMPIELPDSRVRVLLEDLCAAGAGDADGIVDQLAALDVADAPQLDAVLAALDAGTADLCPGDIAPEVEEAVAAGARAAAPTTTAPAAQVAAPPKGSSASGASTQHGTSVSGGTSGPAPAGTSGSATPSNTSSGSAAVGSGNASGSGNQSSTNFGQHVTSEPTTTSTP